MKSIFTTRLLRLLWLAALFLWIAVWLYPLSSAKTRTAGVALLAVIWITQKFSPVILPLPGAAFTSWRLSATIAGSKRILIWAEWSL